MGQLVPFDTTESCSLLWYGDELVVWVGQTITSWCQLTVLLDRINKTATDPIMMDFKFNFGTLGVGARSSARLCLWMVWMSAVSEHMWVKWNAAHTSDVRQVGS
jgi:hypothetical protein